MRDLTSQRRRVLYTKTKFKIEYLYCMMAIEIKYGYVAMVVEIKLMSILVFLLDRHCYIKTNPPEQHCENKQISMRSLSKLTKETGRFNYAHSYSP